MDYVQHYGDNDHGSPSPAIWGRFAEEDIIRGRIVHFYDDFINFHDVAAGEAENMSGYAAIATTGCSIAQLATERNGVVRLTHDGTADDEVGLAMGHGTAGLVMLEKNSRRRAAFEARVRPSDVTNNQAWFIGLAREGSMVSDAAIADGCGAMAALGMAGFRVIDNDNNGIDAVHNDATGEIVVLNEAQVAVAATWYKLGVLFDGAETLNYYVNGVWVAEADIDDTGFPVDVEMTGVFITKQGGTAMTFDGDWWKIACDRD